MRDGITSTEAGIWTLAMPRFWKPLEDKNLLDKDVLKIIKHIDEIDALHELVGGEKWKEVTEKYINALYDVAEQKGWDNLALTWKIADGSISQPKQPLD